MTDDLDHVAVLAAQRAAPDIPLQTLRAALTAYLAALHITVRRIPDRRASDTERDAAFTTRTVVG